MLKATFKLYNLKTFQHLNQFKMPIYHTLGTIPHKRHTQFRKPDGTLYAEELVSTEGFSSLYSLVYHAYPPTIVKTGRAYSVEPKIAREKHLKHTSLIGFNINPKMITCKAANRFGEQRPAYFTGCPAQINDRLFLQEQPGRRGDIYPRRQPVL
jgi:hypothetical protein